MSVQETVCDSEIQAGAGRLLLGWMATSAVSVVLPELVGVMGRVNQMSVPDIEATYQFLMVLSCIPGILGTFVAGRDIWAALVSEQLPDQEVGATHLYI